MGWNEWPLILFTVISQCALGAFWCCAAALLTGRLDSEQKDRLQRAMLAIWIMMIVAFAASSAHLGSPWRGINALFRVGHAPLSNEILHGGLFTGLGIVHWLLCRRGLGSDLLRKTVLVLALLCSVAFLWNSARFYMMPTVPTWDTPLTPIAFVLTALMAGSALASVLFSRAGVASAVRRRLPRLAATALLVAMGVTLVQASSLPYIQSSIQTASDLSPNYAGLMVLRFVLLLGALCLWKQQIRAVTGTPVPTAMTSGIACVGLIMLGEMIGRGVFYGLYMTVGLH